MKRRLLNLLTALSLLLCLCVGVLWVRSHGATRWWEYRRYSTRPGWQISTIYAGVGGGSALLGLGFMNDPDRPPAAIPASGSNWRVDADELEDVAGRLDSTRFGFGFGHGERHVGEIRWFRVWSVALPLWAPTVGFGALPVVRTIRAVVRRRRRRPGHCPACGYNLTGNTSGVCPECGTRAEPGSPS